MQVSVPISLSLTWVFLLLISCIFLISPSLSDPRISQAKLLCQPSNVTVASNLIQNFGAVMRVIVEQVTDQRWGAASFTDSPPALYGLAQCYGDLNQTDCLLCYAESRTKLPRCLPNMGRLFLDGCFLRYDSYNFFNESLDPVRDNFTCGPPAAGVTDSAQFGERVGRVLANLTVSAIGNNGFALAEEEGGGVAGIYALAQCWSTVSANGCKACLADAASKVRSCLPGGEGRAMNAGCYMRYSTQKFYNVPINGGK